MKKIILESINTTRLTLRLIQIIKKVANIYKTHFVTIYFATSKVENAAEVETTVWLRECVYPAHIHNTIYFLCACLGARVSSPLNAFYYRAQQNDYTAERETKRSLITLTPYLWSKPLQKVCALRPRCSILYSRQRGTHLPSLSLCGAAANASRIRHIRTKRRREFTLIRLMAAMKVGLRRAIIFM